MAFNISISRSSCSSCACKLDSNTTLSVLSITLTKIRSTFSSLKTRKNLKSKYLGGKPCSENMAIRCNGFKSSIKSSTTQGLYNCSINICVLTNSLSGSMGAITSRKFFPLISVCPNISSNGAECCLPIVKSFSTKNKPSRIADMISPSSSLAFFNCVSAAIKRRIAPNAIAANNTNANTIPANCSVCHE